MTNSRLASIDIFRALTMLLMIFVIDLSSLSAVANWLGHADAHEDRMGLADIVFPCFLFIVGLSIPYAIGARLHNGDSRTRIMLHILNRTVSLIIMGLLVVNLDNMHDANMLIPKHYWQCLMVIAVFMIWNQYRSSSIVKLLPVKAIQIAGWGLLAFLAYTYRGPAENWMQIHWWGILGLIGWSYGLCALIYLYFNRAFFSSESSQQKFNRTYINREFIILGIITGVFLLLNINEFIGDINLRLVISASNYFCVMLGVFVAVLYNTLTHHRNQHTAMGVTLTIAVGLIAFGLISRPEWGISKIQATPSWTTICGGISIIFFMILIEISDTRKKVAWAKPIAAGGYATLTCYFALYFVYSLMSIANVYWPQVLLSTPLGYIKCLFLAVGVIQLSAWAGKLNIRLSI